MRAVITCQVFPTEDRAKVLDQLAFLFPGVRFSGDPLRGETDGLSHFFKLAANQRIRDAVEKRLVAAWKNGSTKLRLNKQVKRVNIYEDHELGPIELVIECEENEINGLVWS